MSTFSPEALARFILPLINPKEFKRLESALPEIIESFARYDGHFMRLTGVIDERGEWGREDYDEDDAFEYIYDAYLSDHPNDADDDMLAAALLNRYMELKDDAPEA